MSHLNKTYEDILETLCNDEERLIMRVNPRITLCCGGIEPYRLIAIITKTMVDIGLP